MDTEKYALDNDSRIRIDKTKKDYNNKVPIEIKKKLYDELLKNYLLYKNEGNLNFKEIEDSKLLEPSFSNGASYADLDNDGDLDIVVNDIDENAFLYQNLSVENKIGNFLKIKLEGKLSETFAKVTIYFKDKSRKKESKRVRGYLSAVDNSVHFGLGKVTKIDSVLIEWNSREKEVLYILILIKI